MLTWHPRENRMQEINPEREESPTARENRLSERKTENGMTKRKTEITRSGKQRGRKKRMVHHLIKELHSILWYLSITVFTNPPLVPMVSQMKKFHTHYIKFHINIILRPTPWSCSAIIHFMYSVLTALSHSELEQRESLSGVKYKFTGKWSSACTEWVGADPLKNEWRQNPKRGFANKRKTPKRKTEIKMGVTG